MVQTCIDVIMRLWLKYFHDWPRFVRALMGSTGLDALQRAKALTCMSPSLLLLPLTVPAFTVKPMRNWAVMSPRFHNPVAAEGSGAQPRMPERVMKEVLLASQMSRSAAEQPTISQLCIVQTAINPIIMGRFPGCSAASLELLARLDHQKV